MFLHCLTLIFLGYFTSNVIPEEAVLDGRLWLALWFSFNEYLKRTRMFLIVRVFSNVRHRITLNKAGYTAIQSRTGAVMRKPLGIQKWDRRTDLPTDTARCSRVSATKDNQTRPSRPIRCAVWIVERMRYQPTDRPTNRPTDKASYRGALAHLKSLLRIRDWGHLFSHSAEEDVIWFSVFMLY